MFRSVADHKGKDKRSVIFEHLHQCIHSQNSNIDNFKILKRYARGELYSLESMLIEKEKLNMQVSGNGKIALLTIY